MANNQITIPKKTYALAKPQEVLQMANVLKTYIVKQKLYTQIKGKNYAHVDGWQFAGFLVGMTAAIEEEVDLSNDKETKWKVRARLYQAEKSTPHIGVAVCSSKETNKKGFEEYAVLSMAQTRAIGKAYRNRIGWVMKLAGYEATPSEEMRKVDQTPSEPQESVIQTESKKKYHCHGIKGKGCPYGSDEISEAAHQFSMKIFKKSLCRDCQKDAK